MQKGTQPLVWIAALSLCVAALLVTHALRWPERGDVFPALRKSAAALSPALPQDSPVTLRVSGLSEDHFNYLRYCFIPRPLELNMARTSRVVLLCAADSAANSVQRLHRERPDLRQTYRGSGPGYSILLFKSVP